MAHLYTYTFIDMILCLKYINETVVFTRLIWPFFFFSIFLPTINRELFHYLQVGYFLSVVISKVYNMSSPTSQSSPAFKSFFNKEKTSVETATKIDFISSIWDGDHIRRLDENNCQYLWFNQIFQGINATKALAHVLGKKGMNIKSFFVAKD